MTYELYWVSDGKKMRCIEFDGMTDIDDIACPKCGNDEIEWVETDWTGEEWTCECCECGHRFKVEKREFYRIKKEEEE